MKMGLRWLLVLLALGVVAGLAWQRYLDEVAYLEPGGIASLTQAGNIRVLGRVKAGSFSKSGTSEARFVLEGGGGEVQVLYRGPDVDTLRELKTILARGVRQADGSLLADLVTIAPNYGFIAGAFGSAALILLLFAFVVEYQVRRMEKELQGR